MRSQPEGGLALEGQHLLTARMGRAQALVIGPGLGREKETLMLVREIVATATVPVVIDADALQPEIVSAGDAPRVLTPHAGEWARIAESVSGAATVVRKGPVKTWFEKTLTSCPWLTTGALNVTKLVSVKVNEGAAAQGQPQARRLACHLRRGNSWFQRCGYRGTTGQQDKRGQPGSPPTCTHRYSQHFSVTSG